MKRIHPFKIEIVQRGLHQLDVAEKAGLNPTRLNKILNGRTELRDYEERNLRRALGLKQEKKTADSACVA